jgi:uncharacterized UBP type Zn finger protein
VPPHSNDALRRLWTGQAQEKACDHLGLIKFRQTSISVCEQCVALGDSWPELRLCLICGHVGCCEDAKNQHALKHYQETGHPLVAPVHEGPMQWIWCYADEALLDPR